MVQQNSEKQDRNLTELRTRIADIDEEIIILMAERQRVALQVGEAKVAQKLPVKDYLVERNVFERNRKKAEQIGVSEAMADDVSRILIKYAVFAQDKLHRQIQGEAATDLKKILIIGGSGQMGIWLTKYLDSLGHSVVISDSKSTGDAPSVDYLVCDLNRYDAIIIAVPMSAASAVIDLIAERGTDALVFDVCSLKSPVIEAIKKAEAKGVKIASIHPMFGPDAEILSGKNIIFCAVSNRSSAIDSSHEARSYFSQTSARLLSMSLADHDLAMSCVLGLSHLSNLVFADTLANSGLEFSRLDEVASSTFQAQIKVVLPVTQENQDLYYEIQTGNFWTSTVVERFKESLDAFSKIISMRDRDSFVARMNKCRDYLDERKS